MQRNALVDLYGIDILATNDGNRHLVVFFSYYAYFFVPNGAAVKMKETRLIFYYLRDEEPNAS